MYDSKNSSTSSGFFIFAVDESGSTTPSNTNVPDELHLSSEGYDLWNQWVVTALAHTTCCVWQSNFCIHNNTDAYTSGVAAISTRSIISTTATILSLHLVFSFFVSG